MTGSPNEKTSSQQLMNDYLSNPEPAAPRPATADTGASTVADTISQGNKAGSNSVGGGSRRRGSSAFGSNYDYEMQDFVPRPRRVTQRSSRARSTTRYIQHPHFAIGSQFPIQEVVPNSQMAVASGSDPAPGRVDGYRNAIRSRAPTVSSNVADINSIIESNRGKEDGGSVVGDGEDLGDIPEEGEDDDGQSHQLKTPMMVRPKTLHQNPQTPTVLPSGYHPINEWTTLKHGYLKEFLAEFVGTMVMIILGNAITSQVNLAGKLQQDEFDKALKKLAATPDQIIQTAETFKNLVSSTSGGTFDDVALGWAAAGTMGYFASGGSAISGGHLNPSATIANFIFRGFPFKNVFIYIAGQCIGAFAGALILFIFYKRVIEEAFPLDWWKNEAVASMFCVFPKPYLSTSRQFVSEYICTAVLQLCTFALTDPYTSLSSDLFPLLLFILLYVINAAMSYQTGCAMNMARDLGPRLALYAVGFNRHMLWINHHHFFWVPIVAPFVGSMTGGLIYDIAIYQGHESPVNWPLSTYKDIFWRSWTRKSQWRKWRRNCARLPKKLPIFHDKSAKEPAPSEFSDFSYEDDGEDRGKPIDNTEDDNTDPTRIPSPEEAEAAPENRESETVHFKSVGGNNRRFNHNNGIPTIMEENGSVDNESLGSSLSADAPLNSNDSSTDSSYDSNSATNVSSNSNEPMPSFHAIQKKQE